MPSARPTLPLLSGRPTEPGTHRGGHKSRWLAGGRFGDTQQKQTQVTQLGCDTRATDGGPGSRTAAGESGRGPPPPEGEAADVAGDRGLMPPGNSCVAGGWTWHARYPLRQSYFLTTRCADRLSQERLSHALTARAFARVACAAARARLGGAAARVPPPPCAGTARQGTTLQAPEGTALQEPEAAA